MVLYQNHTIIRDEKTRNTKSNVKLVKTKVRVKAIKNI